MPNPSPFVGAARVGTVQLAAASNITLEQLNKAVAHIVGLHGCLACGLVGIDLHILGGDPAIEKVGTLAGIKSINIGR